MTPGRVIRSRRAASDAVIRSGFPLRGFGMGDWLGSLRFHVETGSVQYATKRTTRKRRWSVLFRNPAMTLERALDLLRDHKERTSLARLAVRFQASRSTVLRWLNGDSEPKGENREALFAWAEEVEAEATRPTSVRERGAEYRLNDDAADPRRSLSYWLGRLEEAGGVLEDAAVRHRRIREEISQAIGLAAAVTPTATPAELEAATRRQLAADAAAAAERAREA